MAIFWQGASVARCEDGAISNFLVFWQGVPVARCKDGANGNFLAGCSCGSLKGESCWQFSGRVFRWLSVRTERPAIFWQGVPVSRSKDEAIGSSSASLYKDGATSNFLARCPFMRCRDRAISNFLVGCSCGSL